jgi:hypothetical protein
MKIRTDVKVWVRKNRLLVALVGLLFLVEVGLLLRVGPGGGQLIYWLMVLPDLFWGVVILIAGIAIAISFLVRPMKWYARAAIIAPFILVQPMAWLQWSISLAPLFRTEHITSISFHGHLYHLSFQEGLSGEEYGEYGLYECGAVGFWCHKVDHFVAYSVTQSHDAVLVADPVNDVLYVKWAPNGSIMRQYATIDSLHTVQDQSGEP